MFCNKIFLIEVLSEHFFYNKVRLDFEDVHNIKFIFLQGIAKNGDFQIISESLFNIFKPHIQHNIFQMFF